MPLCARLADCDHGKVMRQVLECDRLIIHSLSDIHYKSMVKLLTERHRLGMHSKYAAMDLDKDPLCHFSKWSSASRGNTVG